MPLKKSEIEKAYVSLFLKFQTAVRGCNLKIKCADTRGFSTKSSSASQLEVTSTICLTDWQYKSASNQKSVTILINSLEEYDCDAEEMKKSTVQVTYFEDNTDIATPMLALHYDFEAPAKPQHPIFHVQLGESKISNDLMNSVGFRRTINSPQALHYSAIRIPTAHMCLSSVLLSLAADHLKATVYTQILDTVRKNEVIKWVSCCAPLPANQTNYPGNLYHSHQWY